MSSEPTNRSQSFPDEALETVLSFIDSHKDRNSVSLVRKNWYEADRVTRSKLFIGNSSSVSPEIVSRRFHKIKSVTLKGMQRFYDDMINPIWDANVHCWIVMFAESYPFLKELRLKRMWVADETLELLAKSFPNFKALSLWKCDGYSETGLQAIATHCKKLTELDILDVSGKDSNANWLSHFPESFNSLEILNFPNIENADFYALEKLVARCKSLRVLKVNNDIDLYQLQQLLEHAPQLVELGTGSLDHERLVSVSNNIRRAFDNGTNIRVLSGFWEASGVVITTFYAVFGSLTFLDLTRSFIRSGLFVVLIGFCPNLRRLWVCDSVLDEGVEAVGSSCPLLEELRVTPDPSEEQPNYELTNVGLSVVCCKCPRLRYLVYFCSKMTNSTIMKITTHWPDLTHFRLYIKDSDQSDYMTNEPLDEGFIALVKGCSKIKRLSISGSVTDLVFEFIGKYANNLETFQADCAGTTDNGLKAILEGCPKLRKLEIVNCPFSDAAFLDMIERYETMRFVWILDSGLTMKACMSLAMNKPRLNVEVINEKNDGDEADKVYIYRTLAGRRKDLSPVINAL